MKKLLFTFLGISLLNVLNAQVDNIDWINENFEPGKCYFSYPLDTNTDEILYLELVLPVFKTIYLKTDTKEFEKMFNINHQSPNDTIIQTHDYTTKFVPRKIDKYCTVSDYAYQTGIPICNVEIPGRYKTLKKIAVIRGCDTLYVVQPEKLVIKRIEEAGQIRLITAEQALNSENIVLSAKGTKWTELREVICGHHPPVNVLNRMVLIQKRLKNLGYFKGNIDGVFRKDSREALLQFQIDNNLPQGRLDIETLKALGVQK